MNCQELARTLEEQELHLLPAAGRDAAQAHLAACPECARDHDLHLRLAALPIPPLQAQTLRGWRALAAGRAGSDGTRRMRGGLFLVGSMAVAAAAAVLVMQLREAPQQVIAESPALPPQLGQPSKTALPEVDIDGEMGKRAPVEPVPSDGEASAPGLAGPAPFTVLIQPLQYETQDPLVQFAVQEFHAALLDGLREIPGLVLVGPDPSIDATTPGDFLISATARPGGRPGYSGGQAQWEVGLRLVSMRGARQIQPVTAGGMFGNGCGAMASPDSAATQVCGPTYIAATIIRSVLMPRFPLAPGTREHLQASLLDSTQPLVDRRSAMNSLRALRHTRGTTADATFVRPLASMAQLEPDDRLRLDAVTLLATDFSDEVDARAALERIAGSDQNMLVRKVAERATSGSSPWRSYAIATARDAGLPVQQRLAPLSWMVDASQREDLVAVVSELLDDGAGMLIELLSGGDTAADRTMSGSNILFALQGLPHPAAADLWLTAFDRVPDYSRLYALGAHLEDPRVRRKFEEVVENSQDNRIRELAAAFLDKSADGQ